MRLKFISALTLFVLSVNLCHSQTEISDSAIVYAVEDQFLFDHGIDINRVTVGSIKGIVELTGAVSNIMAKERATKLAERVKGVRAISNRLEVVPAKAFTDDEIKKNVQRGIQKDPATDKYEVGVAVKNGIVTLSGRVDSYQEKELSADVAKTISGVVGIDNKITVNYLTDRFNYDIQKDIQQSLKWNVWIDDGLIQVNVEKGNVELSGKVASASEKRIATESAWVAGVKSVDNSNLVVDWTVSKDYLRTNKNVVVSDEEIINAIKDAALFDPRVKSINIDPLVFKGRVTLIGTVDNLREKNAAESLAKNTLGVVAVINRLKVQSDKSKSDIEIENEINQSLNINAMTESWEIEVDAHNGIVTLSGIVNSNIEKEEAGRVASTVRGVTEVNNLITINYSVPYFSFENNPHKKNSHPIPTYGYTNDPLRDLELKRNVEKELWWTPFINSDDIIVSVKNGQVTLQGTVDSWKAYYYVTENAWKGGASSVNNELIVK